MDTENLTTMDRWDREIYDFFSKTFLVSVDQFRYGEPSVSRSVAINMKRNADYLRLLANEHIIPKLNDDRKKELESIDGDIDKLVKWDLTGNDVTEYQELAMKIAKVYSKLINIALITK